MRTVNKQTGFTLFETLIYIALFSVIMNGLFFSAYQLFESGARLQKNAQREVELNFIVQKITWMLANIQNTSIDEPKPGKSSSNLRVIKDGEIFELKTTESSIVLIRDPEKNAATYTLSNPTVLISKMEVARSSTTPNKLDISLVVNDKEYATVIYTQ